MAQAANLHLPPADVFNDYDLDLPHRPDPLSTSLASVGRSRPAAWSRQARPLRKPRAAEYYFSAPVIGADQPGEQELSESRPRDESSGSIYSHISPTGGIRPPLRRRSRLALTLAEREEISRGLVNGRSLRVLACSMGRAASTVSREIARNGGRGC